MKYLFLILALLLITFESCSCFIVQNLGSFKSIASRSQAFTKSGITANSLKHSNSALLAKKKGKEVGEASASGDKKKLDPLELILLFMTPWRNPNSIFVYMFLILYVLGKMNETPH